MTNELANYWARLEESVHPDDRTVFREHPEHGFNLDFPPPAFIGDVVSPEKGRTPMLAKTTNATNDTAADSRTITSCHRRRLSFANASREDEATEYSEAWAP